MRFKDFIEEKYRLLKDNPKMIWYWGYKISNYFKKNILNNGERYDPNVLAKFCINDPAQEARYRLAKNLITPDDTVLDIACGTGYGTMILSERCSKIVGVDASSEAIKYANKHYRNKKNISFVHSDIFLFQEQADIAISFETIEHINKSIKETVNKLLLLARKKLILSVPFCEPAGHNKYHLHFNINEKEFDYISKNRKVKYLYQTKDGVIREENTGGTESIIVIIE